MQNPVLLSTRDEDGETIVEGVDERPIFKSGGSFVTSYSKSVLEFLGIVDEDELVDETEVRQRYSIFPDRAELAIELRIEIPDTSELEQLMNGDRPEKPERKDHSVPRKPL